MTGRWVSEPGFERGQQLRLTQGTWLTSNMRKFREGT
jgi:hypothetical protein